MIRSFRAAFACALSLLALPAFAQSPLVGRVISGPASPPSVAIYCDDGTGHTILCSLAGGGGSNAAAGATGSTVPTSGSYTGYIGADGLLHGWLGDNLGHPAVSIFGNPTVANTAFFGDCLVVSADQAYTAGTQQHCTMTSTGRIKIGLSSAATTGTAAATISDLQGAVDPSGNQQPNKQDASGNLQVANRASIFWNGATGAGSALTGSATFTGASRDSGYAAATYHQFGYFNAFYLTDQAGTARIDCSNDNSVWYTCATSAIVAATPLILQVPVMTRYERAVVVNGSSAETYLYVNTSFTGA
jgi:hypothetical protein